MSGSDEILSALGEPTRRAIVESLRPGPMSLGEIAASYSVSRPAISQHVAILKKAGLLTEVREGKRRIYSLNAEGFQPLRQYVDRFWSDILDAFAQAILEKETSNTGNRKKEKKS